MEFVKNSKPGCPMIPIVIPSQVNSDGMLLMSVPMGIEQAGQEVLVTVESVKPREKLSETKWEAWVDSMTGSWQGDFVRPDQGTWKIRDSQT
jgi:hypothetical protein